MILVVTGSRTFNKRDIIWGILDSLREDIEVLFSGNCPTGADNLCEVWARDRGVSFVLVPAVWSIGRPAGFRRNKLMLEIAHSFGQSKTRLLAFADLCVKYECRMMEKHYSHGTQNCIKVAEEMSIRTKIVVQQ